MPRNLLILILSLFSATLSWAEAPYRTATIPIAGQPDQLLAVDLNQDGHLDLVAGCHREVVVLLNDGKGGFREHSRTASTSNPTELAAGDYDKDGHVDIAFADHDTFALWLLRGDGKGGLSRMGLTRVQKTGRPHTHGLFSGDWNRDGKFDALHFNVNEGRAVVLNGDGRGELTPSAQVDLPAPYNPAMADFNGDGILDFAAPAWRPASISVLLGDGKGGFQHAAGSPFRLTEERPYFAAAGDVNGDGKPDVITSHDDTGMVSILLGDGKGGFRKADANPKDLGVGMYGIRILDWNGDGKNDIVGVNDTSYRVLDGALSGSGAMVNIQKPAKAGWRFVAADLDRDGAVDLASAGGSQGGVLTIVFGTPRRGGGAQTK
jgi:hypothetical protein